VGFFLPGEGGEVAVPSRVERRLTSWPICKLGVWLRWPICKLRVRQADLQDPHLQAPRLATPAIVKLRRSSSFGEI
jgi:hypothetical protein